MKEFFSYIIIIAIIALIGFICYMIWKRSSETVYPTSAFPGPNPKPDEPAPVETDYNHTTCIISEWSVVQLHPVSGKQIKKQNLVIPASGGFTIGRRNDCNFVLQGATAEDGVSRLHLCVGQDDKGYFARPFPRPDDSLAITYISDKVVTNTFDLVDQQIVWLGKIPIVFVRNINRRNNLIFNPSETGIVRNREQMLRDSNQTVLPGRYASRNEGRSFTR